MDTPNQEVKAPVPGTPEYEAAMAAKVDESAAAAASAASGEAPVEAPAEAAKEAPAEGTQEAPAEEAAEQAVEEAGLDYSALHAEFAENGELSPESYEKLEKAGIPKYLVDDFIAGQSARAAQVQAQGIDAAGGQQQFDQMKAWASSSLNAAELEAYNKAIEGTPEEMLQAVRGLRSRFESEFGRTPSLLGGSGAASNAGYASRAEMTADMRNPRYDRDPAFRAKVTAKIAATTAF